jgi:hypothetical protein
MFLVIEYLCAFLAAPVALVVGIVVDPASVGSIVLYAIAAVMLATSTVGYCPPHTVARRGGRGTVAG